MKKSRLDGLSRPHLGPLSKSTDGGRAWSDPLPVPADWETVRGTTPTIHYLVDPQGRGRLFVMAGLDFPGRLRQSYSEDGGQIWTPMQDTGLKAECSPKTILSFDGGRRLVMWCDRRDPNSSPDENVDPVVFQSESYDGGLTWSEERIVVNVPTRWAQPAVICDPADPAHLLMLLRYNGTENGRYSVSKESGETWSEVRELSPAMTGHRCNPSIAPDGPVVVVMRDTAVTSPAVKHLRRGSAHSMT